MEVSIWVRMEWVMEGAVNTLRIARTATAAARYHVVFSTMSLVRRTPMIWLLPANDDDRPPPLDFWISTMPMSRMAASSVRIITIV